MHKDYTYTPREIVSELDQYIIGQEDAKRAVAIALRNRWRRQQVSEDLRDEIHPKNIILIGPTGVGKTEIARRLARLARAPFVKVEATKYTEVGYVGKDVESIIRELTETAVKMVKDEAAKEVETKARELAEERVLDILIPPTPEVSAAAAEEEEGGIPTAESLNAESEKRDEAKRATREKMRKMLRNGKFDRRDIEIKPDSPKGGFPMVEVMASGSIEEMGFNIKDMMSQLMPQGEGRRRMKVAEALEFLASQEAQKLIDMEDVVKEAIHRAEQNGIVFLDELDKVAVGREGGRSGSGPDVSREGVQRDILPIVEGSTVRTKHGLVKTDHILFIGAGAFHSAKPSDLIPELQGRFPIRVELKPLHKEDFYRILTEPTNSLTKQYSALMGAESLHVSFNKEALKELCQVAELVNEQMEDIGARRLHTLMEKLLEEISFNAPEMREKKMVIDKSYVESKLSSIVKDRDLSRYIL